MFREVAGGGSRGLVRPGVDHSRRATQPDVGSL
jgi:hypothetical protein